MRQRDGRRRLFKTFTACLLALAMLLTNVGVMDVRAEGVKAPKVNPVFSGDQAVSGSLTIGSNKRKIQKKDCIIHVTVTSKAGGSEEKTVTISYTTRSQNWSVTLDSALAEGDTVTVTQTYGGETSPRVTKTAEKSLKDTYEDTLKMPKGELWIEQVVAKILNDDEKAEIAKMVKDANPSIAKDMSAIELTIGESNQASIEITYSDGSKTDKIQTPNLEIKQVTEYSRKVDIDSVFITNESITGKLPGEGPFDNIKVQLILKVGESDKKNFCEKGSCTVDKNSSDPIEVPVNANGSFLYRLQGSDSLDLNQVVGISVKEPHKFKSCGTTTVKLVTPDKTEVKDPRKLTDKNKEAIDQAIRDANTVDGISKMPDGTGDWDGIPAYIEFDKDGNARIINPSNVEGDWDWDNDGIFVPEKNDDGSLKVKDEEQVIKIPSKDLVKNIKPEAPAVKLSEDEEKVTVTTDLKDTDAKTIKVSYTDPDGSEKTVEATKDDDNWTAPKGFDISVDGKTGAVTLSFPASMAKDGSKVKATVTDNGGLIKEEEPLTSDEGECTLPEKPEVSFDANGGSGTMDSVKVKKGSTYKLPATKFTPPAGKEFKGWEVGGKEYAPGDEIIVESNVIVKAVWNDVKPEPKPEGPTDNRPLYKGSILILPGGEAKAEEPAMEIGRHIRYLYGYEDRTVRPEGKITRAEAAALIARLAELDMSDKSKPDFADTPSSWYNSAINIMVKKNLMFGDKNGNFRPNEAITRGEFARALLYIDAKNDKVAPFADVKGHEFEEAINQAYGNGRINGYPDGTFRPDAYIQRAEAARILNQYANRGTTLEGMAPVAKDLARFTDIDESHWAYCEIMEAANSHEYQRAKGTQAETWLKILYDEMKK